ncbi:iron uptake porin [Myxacorys almedinensis]|uniref:Iron uptake porin n=1 Tax=Myxacorys almedinensis A TaxID=2690445 RepID=A0A8J7Z3L3_9CYAN|nr:iron uptake porin [Myxacorys almedinensis A]
MIQFLRPLSYLSLSSVVFSAILLAPNATFATEPPRLELSPSASDSDVSQATSVSQQSESESEVSQVTSVSQLSDVRPTDWAFQALQSLVERYGCIAGYPDRTYRGNRALTRYEFAAGLNACLDRVNELIAASTADLVKKEDLATLQKLQEEFASELATLRGRVDALEARTTTLERQQFSTTTRLRGETIFSVANVFGDERAGGGDLQDNATLSYRVRLNFESSFTGKDLLRIRLQGRNVPSLSGAVTGTSMTRLSYDGNEGGQVGIDDLFYRFPLGDNTRVWLIANGYGSENIANPLNPFLQSGGSGALSRFGRYSPLYRTVEGPGVAVEQKLGDALTLSLAYRARNASDPAEKAGLFDGNHSALAQLLFSPSQNLSLGLTYTRAYYTGTAVNATGGTGSAFAQRPFGTVATLTNSYGAIASFRVSPQFNISGWAGLTNAEAKAGANQGANADIFNWSVALAFPDLGKKGNLGGIIVGMPPKATSNDIAAREDSDTSLHIEALYRYQLNNKVSITPGVIVILNPEHNRANDTQFVGVVRTTFAF